jgi:glutathione S-transferase
MMILRSAPPSPFGRKVKIAADLVGLHDAIEVVPADTANPDAALIEQNPLGKIPILILADGSRLFDSRVIVEYLDALAGGHRLIPAASDMRWRILTAAALADGIAEAGLLMVYEKRFRPTELQSQVWLDRHAGKVARGLAAFEANLPSGARDISHIGLACALGYLDLRFGGQWRADHPALVGWLDAFAADVPAFAATQIKGWRVFERSGNRFA